MLSVVALTVDPSEAAAEQAAGDSSLAPFASLSPSARLDRAEAVHVAMYTVAKTYATLVAAGHISMFPRSSSAPEPSSSLDKARAWVSQTMHEQFLPLAVRRLGSSVPGLQLTSLRVLMKLIAVESEEAAAKHPHGRWIWSDRLFRKLVRGLLSVDQVNAPTVLSIFRDDYYALYDDVRYHTLRAVARACESEGQSMAPESDFIANAYWLLAATSAMPPPKAPPNASQRIQEAAKAAAKSWKPQLLVVDPNQEDGGKQRDDDDRDDADQDTDDYWASSDDEAPEPDQTATKMRLNDSLQKAASAVKRTTARATKKKNSARAAHTGSAAMGSIKNHRTMFASAWLAFLRLRLPAPLYRAVLADLDSSIMPHLPHPPTLADFLGDSYALGGVTAVLALSSLWTLMSAYGLDVPDFYPRLYALLQPNLLYAKHRPRLFKLLALFLRSPNLPVHTIAAFVKRMTRLALTGPPGGALAILPLVYNMLQMHPATLVLIHRESGPAESPLANVLDTSMLKGVVSVGGAPAAAATAASGTATASSSTKELLSASRGAAKTLSSVLESKKALKLQTAVAALAKADVFDAKTDDPAAARALDSSLWELTALLNHYTPSVARLARVFSGDLRKRAYDLKEMAAWSYPALMEAESNRKASSFPLAVRRPVALVALDAAEAVAGQQRVGGTENGAQAAPAISQAEELLFSSIYA